MFVVLLTAQPNCFTQLPSFPSLPKILVINSKADFHKLRFGICNMLLSYSLAFGWRTGDFSYQIIYI